MKHVGLAIILSTSAVVCGCDAHEKKPIPATPPAPEKTPAAELYRALLEKRVRSCDGADINIMKEVSRYKNSSNDEKTALYKKAEALLKR